LRQTALEDWASDTIVLILVKKLRVIQKLLLRGAEIEGWKSKTRLYCKYCVSLSGGGKQKHPSLLNPMIN